MSGICTAHVRARARSVGSDDGDTSRPTRSRGAPVSSTRRTALGTQPPAAATEAAREASGTIELEAKATAAAAAAIEAHRKAVEADAEHSVIVQIDDDWLARLELPLD